MGFLSRKKPKPAPVEIQEESPLVDELMEMEEAVPLRDEEPPPAEETFEPEPIAVDAISADLKDGILTVTVPKAADRGTRRIDVG